MMENVIFLSIRRISDFHGCDAPVDTDYLLQFTDERRRNESIAARLELNRLAKIHAGADLIELGFRKNDAGKPVLREGFHCSISHADGWVFVGIGAIPFGIDIEKVNQDEHLFLEHAYAKAEWEKVQHNPQEAYLGFSLKEATAKKNGTGFLVDPATIAPAASDWTKTYHMTASHGMEYVLAICADGEISFEFDLPGYVNTLASNQTDWNGSLDIPSLLSRYESKALDVQTVVEECLHRIQQKDNAFRSVIHLNPEALDAAHRLDSELASKGKLSGTLHGVPVLIKANISTNDAMPTSCGSVLLKDFHSTEDAEIVKRLKAEGAVILGKTNLSEFCNYVSNATESGFSSLGGQTQSIFGKAHAVGGSSSGSAVAAAAQFCSIAIGTETDGSVVYPAACNGVYAFKPAQDALLSSGIIGISSSYDQVGLFSDSLCNLEYAKMCLFQQRKANQATCAWLEAASFEEQPAAAALVERLTALLENAGIPVQTTQLSQAIEPHFTAFDIVCKTEFKRDVLPKLPLSRSAFFAECENQLLGTFHPDIQEIERALDSEHDDDGTYQAAFSQLLSFQNDWQQRFKQAQNPVVVALTTGPSEIASIATLMGLAHVVMPWHTSQESSHPIGISLMSQAAQSDSLLHLAHLLEPFLIALD
jgi:Asp-tRNA(Asn)/Glu-tRNA(Gln) amidotransferase A subunit family amidase/phosphopantetheinyl transferase